MNLNKGLTHIQGQVSKNSLTSSCNEKGCRAYLTGIPKQKVVINLEKEFDARGDNRKRCDRLLFYKKVFNNTFVAVLIELKGGEVTESDVRKKLENSLQFASAIAPDPGTFGETVYVPILLHKRSINWTNPKSSNKFIRVNFQGNSVRVRIGKCSRQGNLAKLLSNEGYL